MVNNTHVSVFPSQKKIGGENIVVFRGIQGVLNVRSVVAQADQGFDSFVVGHVRFGLDVGLEFVAFVAANKHAYPISFKFVTGVV